MPATPPRAAGPRGRLVIGAVLVVVIAIAVWAGLRQSATPPAPSPYLNTRPDVAFVGVASCRDCHADRFATYAETPHSLAFQSVDPEHEPIPGRVDHKASGLYYEIVEVDGTMRIRQSITLESGERVPLLDHEVDFVVGSGEFSRTYASAEDGFLLQSPTTWYAATRRWGMSPGYDFPTHPGYSRVLDRACLECHVGRVETQGGTDRRLTIHEDAIGCERCHGPGALHVERQDSEMPPPPGPDWTIVDPVDLSRQQLLDLCAQCHLDHTLTVERPGRNRADWRPGLLLSDYQVTYRLRSSEQGMTVTGHVDQMMLSRCFLESGTMTCLTCHDPHGRPAEDERDAYYRARCLTCHDEADCGEDPAHRSAETATDSCIVCHMPRGDTDIPHFAFTHHRIAVHSDDAPPPRSGKPDMTLVPVTDVSTLSSLERKRTLGLAYLMLADRRPEDPHQLRPTEDELLQALNNARRLLEEAYEEGARDGELLYGLAYLEGRSAQRSFELAKAALEAIPPPSSETRTRALELVVRAHLAFRDEAKAEQYLRQLVKMRRASIDWAKLAELAMKRGDREAARKATEHSLEIEPSHPEIQELAAGVFEALGDPERAAGHRVIAQRLRQKQALDPRGQGPR